MKANYLRDLLNIMSLPNEIESFNFLGWEINNEPILNISRPIKKEIIASSFICSRCTPENGISGFLKKLIK